MPSLFKSRSLHALRVAIAFSPWVASMYLFYWLDASGTWTTETPHRGKISVAILTIGMLSSFLVHSHFRQARTEIAHRSATPAPE